MIRTALALGLILSSGAARAAELSVTADRTSVKKGDFVVYTITTTGSGEVTDTFEPGGTLNYLSDGCRDGGRRTVICTATALRRTFTVSVRYGEVGQTSNRVSFGSESAEVAILVQPRLGDLLIAGTPESPTVPDGGATRIIMTGTNRGPDAMRDVIASADVRGATIAPVPPECSVKSAIVSCRWPDLPPGATMTSTFGLQSVGFAAKVSLSIRSSDVDTDGSNNDRGVPLRVVVPPRPVAAPGDADLAFSRFYLPVINAGDAFSIEAAVENHGPAPASNVRITFPRLDGLAVEEITSPYAMSCDLFGQSAECHLPTMLVDGRVTVTLHLRASGAGAFSSSSGGGLAPNTVLSYFTGRVTSDSHDPDVGNNSASDVIFIQYPPDPTFGAEELRFRRGDLARYTIRVTNSGGDIEVEHVPPPGLRLLTASATNGTCSIGPTLVCKGQKLTDGWFEVTILATATTPGTWDVDAKVHVRGETRTARTRITVTAPPRRGVR
jgi:hypothetical protein